MKTRLKSLKNRICRVALDTIYFTAFSSLAEEYFDDPGKLNILFKRTADLLREVLFDGECEIDRSRKGMTLRETSNLGIYCELSLNRKNLKFNVQFKGVFFASEKALSHMRKKMFALMEELELFFRVTRIDVCQDILLNVDEILPYPNKLSLGDEYKYHFRWEKAEYANSRYGQYNETGFRIYNSRFILRLYDKRAELKKAKNQKKKEYYENAYSQIPSETPITRFELQLVQENCEPYQKIIFDESVDSETLCREVLMRFAQKHKLRKKKEGSRDKDWNRQPIEQNWEHLFFMKEIPRLTLETPKEFRHLDVKGDFNTLKRVIGDYAASEGKSLKEVIEVLQKPEIGDFMAEARERVRKREETARHFKRMREEVLDEGAKPQGKLLL